MKKILMLSMVLLLFSCSNDDDNSNNEPKRDINFQFTHNWDGSDFTKVNFDELEYTNEHGNILSINLLRYLISNVAFIKESGERVPYDHKYIFVDLETPSSTNSLTSKIPEGNYKGISFIFGLNKSDNVSGIYPELNSVSWNWPDHMGGGYHFLQMEGNYESQPLPAPYAYHMGTAMAGPDNFEENHFEVTLNKNFVVDDATTVELKMNIAEWFKNPNTWNLFEYNVDLMMNYDAQIMMNENGRNVFSLGEID